MVREAEGLGDGFRGRRLFAAPRLAKRRGHPAFRRRGGSLPGPGRPRKSRCRDGSSGEATATAFRREAAAAADERLRGRPGRPFLPDCNGRPLATPPIAAPWQPGARTSTTNGERRPNRPRQERPGRSTSCGLRRQRGIPQAAARAVGVGRPPVERDAAEAQAVAERVADSVAADEGDRLSGAIMPRQQIEAGPGAAPAAHPRRRR